MDIHFQQLIPYAIVFINCMIYTQSTTYSLHFQLSYNLLVPIYLLDEPIYLLIS